MFGYINICKDELKIKDYNMFRAYYCGLCKTLGERYNQITRLGLSYDMTFLAIAADSLSDDMPQIKSDGCIKHIGKHAICEQSDSLRYAADMSIILFYYKLKDDIEDDNSVKARIASLPYIRAVKRAEKLYPEIAAYVKEKLSELSKLEREECPMTDMAADPFAKLTEKIFSGCGESLSSLGYNIGRFIYLADAASDIEEDLKNNSYNPFICSFGRESVLTDEFRQKAMGSINMTLYAVLDSYRAIDFKKNKPILDNIIYMGLRRASENLFKNTEERKK